MSKESSKKRTKQPTHENALLEEEIDSLASNFQDIITKIASEKSSEKNPSGKSSNKNSQEIKSEITKQLRSFNERTKSKIDSLQQRYEQDIKNQQIKYSQLEEKFKQQEEAITISQSDELDKEKYIS